MATDTLVRLAEHPRIVGVKDAKGDLAATSQVLARSDLAYYSGDDPMNLPLWSVGAVGCVSVTGHVVGDRIHAMLEAFTAGRNAEAARLHRSMLPVNVGLFRNQAAVMTKAALDLLGLPGGGVRGPLLPASDAERQTLIEDLTAGGVKLPREHCQRSSPVSFPHPDLTPPPALPSNGLRVIALGGLGEIGRNMTVFEYLGRLLIVDCGVLFPEPDQPGVDLILPDFRYLEDRLDDVEALVLTHAHEDHIGAVPYLLRERARHPAGRVQADPRPDEVQAHRAPPDPGGNGGQGGNRAHVRTLRP